MTYDFPLNLRSYTRINCVCRPICILYTRTWSRATHPQIFSNVIRKGGRPPELLVRFRKNEQLSKVEDDSEMMDTASK